MPTVTVTLPRPHPGQLTILREAKRYNVVACGRRFGKTTLGLHRLTGPALAGQPVAWFAPTFKYLAEAWRDFKRVLRPVISRTNETERRIELVTGGVLDFWSLEDPDAGRSRKYKRVAIDEAAKVKRLEHAWNEAIRATLTDLKGDADFYSTPKGRNFFWRGFTWGEDGANDDWACWRFPTVDNPYIDPAEVEAARRQLPERVFRQEYLAEFLDEAGGVFRRVSESIDRGRTSNLVKGDSKEQYSAGLDLARLEDFTVITIVDSTGKQVYFERFNQISWERQIGAVVAAVKPFNAVVYVDSTGVGDPIFERLLNAGVQAQPYQFTNASKGRLIDQLAMQLEQGKLRLMDIPEQENELVAYAYELTAARNVRMGAPEGMHDDTVIALALASWAAAGAGTYSAGAW
jgi:phage terminase large subunit-like protein